MALYDSSQGSVNLSGSGSSESAPCASHSSMTAAFSPDFSGRARRRLSGYLCAPLFVFLREYVPEQAGQRQGGCELRAAAGVDWEHAAAGGELPSFVPNKPCVERASACQARACTGAEGFIHSDPSHSFTPPPIHTNAQAAAASSSACAACCTSGSAPRSAPVSTWVSNNSSEASCGLFPKHVSTMCTWHCSGLDASAHTPHGASMVVVGFVSARTNKRHHHH
jgi:hypothetical protein